MTQTALIGSTSTLGNLLSSKRFFDYLINLDNLSLVRGKQFAELVLICPSLWEVPGAGQEAAERQIQALARLMEALQEVKVERLTYITGFDLIPIDGDEESPLLCKSDDSRLAALIQFRDTINFQFGRVLTIRLPELLGVGDGFSVLGDLRQAQAAQSKVSLPLLAKHQFYPASRLLKDIDKSWACGMFSVNFATHPVTIFDVVELFFPDLINALPLAKASDPSGSDRKSVKAFYWNDPMDGYIMDKEGVIEAVVGDILAAYGEGAVAERSELTGSYPWVKEQFEKKGFKMPGEKK